MIKSYNTVNEMAVKIFRAVLHSVLYFYFEKLQKHCILYTGDGLMFTHGCALVTVKIYFYRFFYQMYSLYKDLNTFLSN